jgi:hypothetical protein
MSDTTKTADNKDEYEFIIDHENYKKPLGSRKIIGYLNDTIS